MVKGSEIQPDLLPEVTPGLEAKHRQGICSPGSMQAAMEFALTAPFGADDSYGSGYAGGVALWNPARVALTSVRARSPQMATAMSHAV